MRHRVYGYKLKRDNDSRQLLFKGLVKSLFTHGTIQTSEAKAKAIKGLVDKMITLAKNSKTQDKFHSYISNSSLSDRFVKEVLPKMGNRVSGYTSTIRMGTRSGDQTMMIKMSLIGAESLKPIEKSTVISKQSTDKKQEETKKPKTPTSSLRGGSKTRRGNLSKKSAAKKKVVKK